MSNQDQEFQKRWEIRTNQDDLDSSSDDQLRPNIVRDPKLKNHKPGSKISLGEHNQKTNDNKNEDPRSETNLSCEETKTKKEPNAPRRNLRSKGKGEKKKPERLISLEQDNPFDGALNDLRSYAESLMEGIKVAREGMLDWMTKEMAKSCQNDMVCSKPNIKGKAKNDKPTRNSPIKSRRKPGTTNRKPNSGSSDTVKGKTTSYPANTQVAETHKETKNGPTITTPSPSEETKKRKRSGLSEKKHSRMTGVSDQQSKKVITPATSVLALPVVVSRPQTESSEKSPMESGLERNKISATSSLSSPMAAIYARNQQKDRVYSQTGLRNVSDYEQGKVLRNGNGNGYTFPFTYGSDGGIGIPNTNQFGIRFLNQENSMNGGITRIPSASNSFLENYSHLDQHWRFQVQNGVMDMQSYPDTRRPNFQPR